MIHDPVTLPPLDGELVQLLESMCDGTINVAERDRLEGDPRRRPRGKAVLRGLSRHACTSAVDDEGQEQ